MSRTKTSIIFCAAVAVALFGPAIVFSVFGTQLNTWLHKPLDPGRYKRRHERELVQNQLSQIHSALLRYAAQNGSHLPPLNTLEQAKRALAPYVKDSAVFISPVTHHPFQPNGFLSQRRLQDIAHPSQVVVFYDVHPIGRGYEKNQPVSYPEVDVLFLNGKYEIVSTFEWPQFRKASKIP